MSRRPTRSAGRPRRGSTRRLNFEGLEGRELLANFVVTSAGDNGNNLNPTPGSLRAAIIAANADPAIGGDLIAFNIAGAGIQTITPPSSLPALTRPVLIDATTQPGFGPNNAPVVVLDGSAAGAGAIGLTFGTNGSGVVRGLSIVGFLSNPGAGGAGIYLQGPGNGTLLSDNYIGILPDGSTAKSNSSGVVVASANNTVGGFLATTRNVISGNRDSGVLLIGTGATGNVILGNYIGTNSAGNGAVGNLDGITVSASGNTIGGTVTGAGNVISGNTGPTSQTGIGILFSGTATSNVVQGNRIGTDATGMVGLRNVYGVYFGNPNGSGTDDVSNNSIGGTVSGAGNLISANFIGITGNVTAGLIAGNTIGLDATGFNPLGNGFGLFLGATNSTIGGTTAAARNVISSSGAVGAAGTGLDLTGVMNLVEGNYVGLTAAGGGGTGIGNVVGMALHVISSTIGGTATGAGNVVSGNSSDGITIDGDGGVVVQGNLIGRTVAGDPLGNAGNGIAITIAVPTPTPSAPLPLNDLIGGTIARAGNTIFGSGGAGVLVSDNSPTGVTGLQIRGNSISGNSRLGIDLTGSGVPIPSTLFINSSSVSGGFVTVSGVYFGEPLTTYGIDLFANGADPSGFGQGPIYLGSVSVTTNSSGFATFSPAFPSPATPYTSFSATVTDPLGNTSEFSANSPLAATAARADLAVTSTASASAIIVGNTLTLTETIRNAGPSTADNVTLFDSLPTTLVNTQVTTTVGTASIDVNNTVMAAIGTLTSGQTVTITITGVVSQAGTISDMPGVSSTTFDPAFANNSSQQTITVTNNTVGTSADLAIAAIASVPTVTAGGNLTYLVTVTNNGPAVATNATVNDFLPSGVTLVSATPSQGAMTAVSGTLLTANFGTIASRASATLTVVVTANTAGSKVNAANVSGNQFDPVAGNNSTSVTTTVSASTTNIGLVLSEAVFPTSAALVGQYEIFTLTLTNSGADTATNATLINSLPKNSTLINVIPSQGQFASLSNGVLTNNFGTIASGASATLTIVVASTAPGVLTNFSGAFSPDVPTAPASFAYGSVSVPSGPSVIGVAGSGSNSTLSVFFDADLMQATAINKGNFRIVSLGTNGRSTPKNIPITAISYNASTRSVTLTPSQALQANQIYQLTVSGSTFSGITDVFGRRLVNPQYSTPGGTFTVTFLAGNLPQV